MSVIISIRRMASARMGEIAISEDGFCCGYEKDQKDKERSGLDER